ncbi:putative 2-hydroxyisoflavanone dehydratase [Iris pallida]|uniref:2-hydroxyisoflavanone dehydratase n=1 Tax=Iris pallida TaxID=29817 RepID=A0AAX6GDI6_IRIPA|nr:putative 2-hydroxyisoflavanone dehydratase [Iris pallida]KAJ6826533.1 putative 2-hydroxyisoflavanone dehydratase [Iris pallida]
MSIVAEVPGILQLLSDGSVKRFPLPTTAASDEFSDGYKTKDVVIDSAKPITARIFVPDTGDDLHRLPVLMHFHGGGFCICSTTWLPFHAYLGGVCVKSQVLIVSVDYRLAPEHKIPTPYDDCHSSLQWLASNACGGEPWLGRADLSRVFLSGESAGANIVHHVMLRVARDGVEEGLNIRGLMIIHPYFGSEERIESELAEGMEAPLAKSDLFWRLSLPEGSDRDHWASNFEKTAADAEGLWQRFPAVAVFIAGMDLLKERGIMYAEFLRSKGLAVDVVVAEGQEHAFHLLNHDSDDALLLQSQMADFMNKH